MKGYPLQLRFCMAPKTLIKVEFHHKGRCIICSASSPANLCPTAMPTHLGRIQPTNEAQQIEELKASAAWLSGYGWPQSFIQDTSQYWIHLLRNVRFALHKSEAMGVFPGPMGVLVRSCDGIAPSSTGWQTDWPDVPSLTLESGPNCGRFQMFGSRRRC